jgi:hypothetical protein
VRPEILAVAETRGSKYKGEERSDEEAERLYPWAREGEALSSNPSFLKTLLNPAALIFIRNGCALECTMIKVSPGS